MTDVINHRSYLRWENSQKKRYYEVRLLQNLFGEWELFCVWGGVGTNLGNAKSMPIVSREDAYGQIDQIAARRKQHRYLLVETNPDISPLETRAAGLCLALASGEAKAEE